MQPANAMDHTEPGPYVASDDDDDWEVWSAYHERAKELEEAYCAVVAAAGKWMVHRVENPAAARIGLERAEGHARKAVDLRARAQEAHAAAEATDYGRARAAALERAKKRAAAEAALERTMTPSGFDAMRKEVFG